MHRSTFIKSQWPVFYLYGNLLDDFSSFLLHLIFDRWKQRKIGRSNQQGKYCFSKPTGWIYYKSSPQETSTQSLMIIWHLNVFYFDPSNGFVKSRSSHTVISDLRLLDNETQLLSHLITDEEKISSVFVKGHIPSKFMYYVLLL